MTLEVSTTWMPLRSWVVSLFGLDQVVPLKRMISPFEPADQTLVAFAPEMLKRVLPAGRPLVWAPQMVPFQKRTVPLVPTIQMLLPALPQTDWRSIVVADVKLSKLFQAVPLLRVRRVCPLSPTAMTVLALAAQTPLRFSVALFGAS